MENGYYLLSIYEAFITNDCLLVRHIIYYKNETINILDFDCDKDCTCSTNSNATTVSDSSFLSDIIEYLVSLSPRSYSYLKTLDNIKYDVQLFDLAPGQSFIQIYRPKLNHLIMNPSNPIKLFSYSQNNYSDLPIVDNKEYYNSINQLEIIIDLLNSVFKVVAPNKKNKEVFGNEIRNMIILACTEVDSMMRDILTNNQVKSRSNDYTTKDYYKLVVPLRLKEYTLSLARYNDLGDYKPFKNWDSEQPTASLNWYKAYNSIKHDRLHNFSLASIDNAINSIMALSIVIIAQYGYRNDLWNEKLGKIIKVKKEPNWNISEFYITDYNGKEMVNYPFN